MGIDQLSKRCACGLILRARESCKRCADAARARLHADGVASSEEREIPHLSMWGGKRKHGTWAEDEGRPPLAERQRRMFGDGHAMEPAPHGFQLHGLRGARFGAVGSLDEWAAGGLDAWTRSQSYEPPPVDRTFQVAYPGTWEDGAPVYTNACGMPSRTLDPFVTREQMELGQADHDRRWREDTQRGVSDFFIGTDYGDATAVAVAVTSLRLKHDTWFVLDVQELAKHEPPPVGAEVAWDVAKADMQARSEARYRPANASPSVRFRMLDGITAYSTSETEKRWTEYPPHNAHTVRWVRLA